MPTLPFRTFLFDLDGTLIDHFTAIHRSHDHVMRQFGLPPPTMAEVKRAVGRGLEHAVEKLFGPKHADKVPAAVPVYRAYWAKTMLDDVELLPGAIALLTKLREAGARTAVFTNKHGPSAREVCDKLALTPLLDGVFGALDTPWLKPERDFADHVLKQLQAEAATSLLIGDSPFDIQAAHNAGFPCWCVITGTHTAAELTAEHADRVFADLAAVQSALLG
jgi:phosphoglycolate phosphatase